MRVNTIYLKIWNYFNVVQRQWSDPNISWISLDGYTYRLAVVKKLTLKP